MPFGYVFSVVLVSLGVACALTSWRRMAAVSAVPALLVNELPFIVGAMLTASTVFALVEGDLATPAGAAAAGVALLALAGLAVVVRRATRAHTALGNVGPPNRPWARILRSPFFPGRRDVVRTARAYGQDPRHTVDIYHRRDRPTGMPILLHLHGGAFRSGDKSREGQPLIRFMTSRHGLVCASANYRLQPTANLADQVDDVCAAIAWIRAHAEEFGGDPNTFFITGASAGANLAIRAARDHTAAFAGLICRYGYYGGLAPLGDLPPILVLHGDKDLWVPASDARKFAGQARTASSQLVTYAELPGAHHNFDMFESIRATAINDAVARFIADAVAGRPADQRSR